MIESLKISIANLAFWIGYFWFKSFGKTPWYSYQSLRKLFYTSNTQFNKQVSDRISKKNPKYEGIPTFGILGNLSEHDVEVIARQIQQDGYFIFPTMLSEEFVSHLVRLSYDTKAKLIPMPKDGTEFDFYKPGEEKAIKYQYFEEDLIKDVVVQKLITDPSILSVTQSFLKSKPILDILSMWWSTSISKQASSEVAQLFHWDMERIKFLKFFFYLTDVDTNTGPHCYVKGSNNGFPESVRRDGRITDDEIKQAFPKENILEIAGKKGLILAVDTSGFHKGKNLIQGNRLLLQFEFSNSLFGVESKSVAVNKPSLELKQMIGSYPFIYQRYTL
jgi:hypothetical protein